MKDNKKICCVGAGNMGQQIALQCAMNGFEVQLYSRKKSSLENASSKIKGFTQKLISLNLLKENDIKTVLERINYTDDSVAAAADAYILIESIPENLEAKRSVFKLFEPLCPADTIMATNSSSIIPSKIADVLKLPEKFLALHFHTYVWEMNIVDIMPHPTTNKKTVDQTKLFALSIKQVPILMKKESPGFIFTALLSSLNNTSLSLVREDVATHNEIDKAWRAAMKMPIGPFAIMDYIGLDTLKDVCTYWAETTGDEEVLKNVDFLNTYVEKGHLGIKSGKGFYNYTKD